MPRKLRQGDLPFQNNTVRSATEDLPPREGHDPVAQTSCPVSNDSAATGVRLLRLPEVMRIASLGRTSIYSLIQHGSFPAPVKVGGASRWASSEVDDWINRLLLTRNGLAGETALSKPPISPERHKARGDRHDGVSA